jgi:hypothetical protein
VRSDVPCTLRGPLRDTVPPVGGWLWLIVCVLSAACSTSPAAPSPPTLKVTAIAPAIGSTTGDTAVTITGTDFAADATVTIGGVPAAAVAVLNASSISAIAGVHPATGPADVVVTSGGKSATLRNAFQFTAPTGTNLPPAIVAIHTGGGRPRQPPGFANIDDQVSLIPTIANAETTGVTLTYEWNGPGTFTATTDGTTTWHLPSSVSPSPAPVTATLVVTEAFVEGAVMHRQASSPFAFVLQLHDSRQEVLDMGEDFLTRFTRQLPTDTVLHNFSATCDGGRGREQEANDTDDNRRNIVEDFNAFRISRRTPFDINFRSFCPAGDKPAQLNTDACSSFSIWWEGFDREENARFVTKGIDYVSAVLENNQWKLCHSTFVGTDSYPSLGITREVSW